MIFYKKKQKEKRYAPLELNIAENKISLKNVFIFKYFMFS